MANAIPLLTRAQCQATGDVNNKHLVFSHDWAGRFLLRVDVPVHSEEALQVSTYYSILQSTFYSILQSTYYSIHARIHSFLHFPNACSALNRIDGLLIHYLARLSFTCMWTWPHLLFWVFWILQWLETVPPPPRRGRWRSASEMGHCSNRSAGWRPGPEIVCTAGKVPPPRHLILFFC